MDSKEFVSMDRAREQDACTNCSHSFVCGIYGDLTSLTDSGSFRGIANNYTASKGIYEVMGRECNQFIRGEEE